jgi:uncharacterized membrane protein
MAGIGRIDFGILHIMGIAMILAIPFRNYRSLNIALWVALVILGGIVQTIDVNTLLAVPLGIAPADYLPLDYFTLLPWFGVVLLGIGLGNILYSGAKRLFPLPDWSSSPAIQSLSALGSNSLWIYVIHQPVIWAILFLLGMT